MFSNVCIGCDNNGTDKCPGPSFPGPCQQMVKGRASRKWDAGKLKYSLVLPEFLELMAEILTKGEINHPKESDGTPSWQLVEPVAYQNALERHFVEYKKGNLVDDGKGGMGTDHMGNIAVNAMFLWWFNRRGK